jgi:hypothetical protein
MPQALALTVSDACAPFEPSLVEAAIRTIEMSGGIFGAVAEASAVLAALATEVNVAHVG